MTHRMMLHTSSDSCVVTCMESTCNHSHEARMTHHCDVWVLKIQAVQHPYILVCSLNAVVFLHLDFTSIMPQGGLHLIQHYLQILYRMIYESMLLLYCSVSNRQPQNDIPLFVFQAQKAHMLCRIGSHLTGAQSNTKQLQALSQNVLPERSLFRNQACDMLRKQVYKLSALQRVWEILHLTCEGLQ